MNMSLEKGKGYKPEVTKARLSEEQREISYQPKNRDEVGYFVGGKRVVDSLNHEGANRSTEEELPEITDLEPVDEVAEVDAEIDNLTEEPTIKTDRGVRLNDPNVGEKKFTASFGLADGGHAEGAPEKTIDVKMETIDEEERTAEMIAAAILKLEAKLASGVDGNTLYEMTLARLDDVEDTLDGFLEEDQPTVRKQYELEKKVLEAQADWLEAHLHLEPGTAGAAFEETDFKKAA